MTMQTVMPARQFNVYHYHDGLLFQFILAEFIEAYQEIILLANSLNDLEKPPPRQMIEKSWYKLMGSSKENMSLVSWNLSNGTLVKLKNYCALFAQNASVGPKEAMALLHYADKAWLSSMQGIDLLRKTPEERNELRDQIEKIRTALNRLSKLIARMFAQFRDDENVIYFLVRNYQAFDNVHGPKFVSKQLGRLFTKGIPEAQLFVTKKYLERGFDNMLPTIDKLFAELNTAS